MADKTIAPVGSHFTLKWVTDAYVELENRFHVRENGVVRVEVSKGRPPKKGNMVKKQFVPVPLKGKVIAALKITKDGQENGFKDKKLEAQHAERLNQADYTYYHEYTFIFVARAVGEYVFTIDFTFEPSANKSALTAPPQLVKEVSVVAAEPLSHRREDMLALIDRWLPSSVYGAQKLPNGEGTKDILALSAYDKVTELSWTMPLSPSQEGNAPELPQQGGGVWTQGKGSNLIKMVGEGQRSRAKRSYNENILPKQQAEYDQKWPPLKPGEKATDGRPARPAGIPIDTSCIAVMGKLVTLWGKQFTADMNTMVKPNKAYYVIANEEFAKPNPQLPKPGDILYLCKEENRGEFQHVCFLVSRSSELWVTAEGGGGALPEQTATINNKPISWTKAKPAMPGRPAMPSVPMFESVTDNKAKALHGWVDIDKVENKRFDDKGIRTVDLDGKPWTAPADKP